MVGRPKRREIYLSNSQIELIIHQLHYLKEATEEELENNLHFSRFGHRQCKQDILKITPIIQKFENLLKEEEEEEENNNNKK